MVYLLSAWVKTKIYLIEHGEATTTTTTTVNVYKTTFNLHLYMAIIYIGCCCFCCCCFCCCHFVCRTHCLTFLYYRWRNDKQMQPAAAEKKNRKNRIAYKLQIAMKSSSRSWNSPPTKYLNKMPAIQIVQ